MSGGGASYRVTYRCWAAQGGDGEDDGMAHNEFAYAHAGQVGPQLVAHGAVRTVRVCACVHVCTCVQYGRGRREGKVRFDDERTQVSAVHVCRSTVIAAL